MSSGTEGSTSTPCFSKMRLTKPMSIDSFSGPGIPTCSALSSTVETSHLLHSFTPHKEMKSTDPRRYPLRAEKQKMVLDE